MKITFEQRFYPSRTTSEDMSFNFCAADYPRKCPGLVLDTHSEPTYISGIPCKCPGLVLDTHSEPTGMEGEIQLC